MVRFDRHVIEHQIRIIIQAHKCSNRKRQAAWSLSVGPPGDVFKNYTPAAPQLGDPQANESIEALRPSIPHNILRTRSRKLPDNRSMRSPKPRVRRHMRKVKDVRSS